MIKRLKIQQDKLLLAERYSAWESVARKLAHEIKNPLTPIQLSIDRLKDKFQKKIQSYTLLIDLCSVFQIYYKTSATSTACP